MKMEVTGIEEMRGELQLMRSAVRTQATRAAVRKAARKILEAMVERAPELDQKTAGSWALPPGTLKGSLRVAIRTKGAEGVISAWIGPAKVGQRVAHMVEYGHRLIKGGRSRVGAAGPVGEGKLIGDVPAHPFLRPGFEASMQAALTEFVAELRAQLGKWLR